MLFPPCRACAFFLLAQKKGTKKKGARVSGGCAVPSPLAVRRAARKLVLRTRTACAACPPPWLRGSTAPDGDCIGKTEVDRRGTACRARNQGQRAAMGTQASRLRMTKGLFSVIPRSEATRNLHASRERDCSALPPREKSFSLRSKCPLKENVIARHEVPKQSRKTAGWLDQPAAGWLDQPAAGWLDQPALERHGALLPRYSLRFAVKMKFLVGE